jgi:hypothetical protein
MSVQLFSAVFAVGLSERLLAALGALTCNFSPGSNLMQRLAKPSDYVLQNVLGKQMYLIPWEPLCLRCCLGRYTAITRRAGNRHR